MKNQKEIILTSIMVILFLLVGYFQSWSLSLTILNMCIISAIMSMGINMQWGYAGIFNVGIMGFTALGGLAAVLVSHAPIVEAWSVGGMGIMLSLMILIVLSFVIYFLNKILEKNKYKIWIIIIVAVLGYILLNIIYRPAVFSIEAVNPSLTGWLGGLGLPIIFSWFVGGIFAAAVALSSASLALASAALQVLLTVLHLAWVCVTTKTDIPDPDHL